MRKYIIRRFGMYQYILVCTKKALSKHSIYQYIQYQEIEGFSIWGQCFDVAKWMYTLPMYSTTYPGVQSEKNTIRSKSKSNLVCTGTYKYILSCTYTQRSQPLFTSNQALSALRRRRVSNPRLILSSRAAFFLSVVSSMVRPPRRGLQRPNCHSHWLTSYTLLPHTHCCCDCYSPLLRQRSP